MNFLLLLVVQSPSIPLLLMLPRQSSPTSITHSLVWANARLFSPSSFHLPGRWCDLRLLLLPSSSFLLPSPSSNIRLLLARKENATNGAINLLLLYQRALQHGVHWLLQPHVSTASFSRISSCTLFFFYFLRAAFLHTLTHTYTHEHPKRMN